MVIPRALREEAGIAEGTLIKIAAMEGGRFLLTPQLTIDRPVLADNSKNRRQAIRQFAEIVDELRQEAKEKGLDSLPSEEINRAVTKARRNQRRKTIKPPAR